MQCEESAERGYSESVPIALCLFVRCELLVSNMGISSNNCCFAEAPVSDRTVLVANRIV